MFNTEWNHYLQNFDHPLIYWLMEAVSFLGTTIVLTLMVYVLIAGITFRRGFGVANIFLYVLLVTIMLKNEVDFPRPLAVDSSLKNFGRDVGADLTDLQPVKFWELFSDDILQEIREEEIGRYGWPSGHTSLITALFLGSALIFRRRALWLLAISLIVLTMISRMYLARHYLGDVLGGLIVGVTITYAVYFVWNLLNLSKVEKLTNRQKIFFLVPLIFLMLPMYLPSFQVGSLIGFNLSFIIVLSRWGVPEFSTAIYKRVLAVLVFFTCGFTLLTLTRKTGLPDYHVATAFAYAVTSMIAFIGAAWICFLTGLWKVHVPEALKEEGHMDSESDQE